MIICMQHFQRSYLKQALPAQVNFNTKLEELYQAIGVGQCLIFPMRDEIRMNDGMSNGFQLSCYFMYVR